MPPASRFRWSVKRTVLALLLPALALIGALALVSAYHTATQAANSAYDRSLLGAIKAIDANISTASGGLSVETPYVLFEFFELTASGDVYFRVATEDGLVVIGNPDLPPPPAPLKSHKPQFYEADYFGYRMRVGAYARNLDRPLTGSGSASQRIIIQVAESMTSRREFIYQLLVQAAWRDLLLVLAAGGLLFVVLDLALRPLARLRDEVQSRSPQDLTPIDEAAVPADVRPLVDAINQHMARNRQFMEERRRFVDDASHQLRTPLATLRTQIDYVLRESNPDNVQDALQAVSRQLDDATHRTNQMLSLAKADAAELAMADIDLVQLAEQVAREVVHPAREKRIDLELTAPDHPLPVHGHAGLLREAALNLLHNAIRFAPEQGRVSLAVGREGDRAMFVVSDDGPGVPPDQLPRIGERFFRARNTGTVGSGLGLAIARAVVERHGGKLAMENLAGGRGCVVTLILPVEPAAAEGALTGN